MLKDMKMKMANMGESEDDVVAAGGFSNKGLSEKGPEYPYCLKLYLGPDELAKLGITELPALDDKMDLVAKVEVVGLRQEHGNNTMEVQIVAMELSEPKKEKSAEQALYGEETSEG